jgi:hypothetical protein
MSVILFFGFSLLVLLAGFTITAISLRHMWKNRAGQKPEESISESIGNPANLDPS